MEAARSDNNKKLEKDFDSWKKIAQSKIRDYKNLTYYTIKNCEWVHQNLVIA